MILCHRIGERVNSNFNEWEEIASCHDQVISFDGIYSEVMERRYDLQSLGKKIILFQIGKYAGGTNDFDVGQPYGEFCDWHEVIEMSYLGFEMAYHSWSHKDLRAVSDINLMDEIKPPFPMKKFAYPFGWFDDRVVEVVKRCGYEEAYSVMQGDGSKYQQNRHFLNW